MDLVRVLEMCDEWMNEWMLREIYKCLFGFVDNL